MKFTIITLCYNSSATLENTFQSLMAIKEKNFEWILIDDFSTDEGRTRKLIRSFQDRSSFIIKWKFLEQNHFGSRSVHEACLLAEGEYACILDHDDQLTPDALVIVEKYIEKFSTDDDFAGVCGRCADQSGRFIGDRLPVDFISANEAEVRFVHRIKGEMFQFTKLDILRKYFEKMKPGYTNGYAWAKISKNFRYLYVNDILRVYLTSAPGSVSNNKNLRISYPDNRHQAQVEILNTYSAYLRYNPFLGFRIAASAVRHAVNSSGSAKPTIPLKDSAWLFYYLSVPLGWLKAKKLI